MKVTWTNTFTADFDLDQAQQDFYDIMDWDPDKDPDSAIYDAVEHNCYFEDWEEEYIDISEAIEICAKTLRKRIGGVQIKMEVD